MGALHTAAIRRVTGREIHQATLFQVFMKCVWREVDILNYNKRSNGAKCLQKAPPAIHQ